MKTKGQSGASLMDLGVFKSMKGVCYEQQQQQQQEQQQQQQQQQQQPQ
ncbi:hypothetical protein [Helicobacter bizzozeronii]|nr:hypothetical protein [Helicobacter bizzozeronii]